MQQPVQQTQEMITPSKGISSSKPVMKMFKKPMKIQKKDFKMAMPDEKESGLPKSLLQSESKQQESSYLNPNLPAG